MRSRKVAWIAVSAVRFLLSAWVGAAVLFVVTSVAEQLHPEFDSVVRDQLATVRFPLYYLFAAFMLGGAALAGMAAVWSTSGQLRRRFIFALTLTLLSAGGAAADFVWIYRPLEQLITPAGQVRTDQFVVLHNRSRRANEFHLSLAFLAALAANVPGRSEL